MSVENTLNTGITAFKDGDTAKAVRLFMKVVKADPNSEQGWLWLGLCTKNAEQREYCFRRVLAINPRNADALHQIEVLNRPAEDSHVEIPLPNAESDTSDQATTGPEPKLQENNNQTFVWVGGGLVLLILIVAGGILFLGRMGALKNTGTSETNVTPVIATSTANLVPNYAPVFETSPCSFSVPDRTQVTCGFVTVPEDRSGDLSDTIRIAVAIFHGTGNGPKSDPILYLQGGPGDKAIDWAANAYPSVIAPLTEDRDFIVFDPRGVGLSRPTLDCDEIGQTYLSDIQGKLPADQKISYYEGALLTCKNNLLKLGVNLSAYTSTQMAADAKDVLKATGYPQANLYGVSYGTRIAQLVMRDYPEIVHSAILDSVVPIEVQLFDQNTNESDQVLRSLFDKCQNDPGCSAAYPDLESVYNSTLDRLNTQPVKLNAPIDQSTTIEQVVDGSVFRNTVIGMLRTPQTIAVVPQLIYRTHNGDDSTLAFSTALPIYAFGSISLGTYISVNCHDQIVAMSLEKLDEAIYDLCQLWDVTPLSPGENDPVISDIPTLIFSGEYDLVTPASFAHQLAEHLSHSYIAEIPNQGHAPSTSEISDCPGKIISSFLHDPTVSPDFQCIKEAQTIGFVLPYSADPPINLEPVRLDQYLISTRIPAGWSAAGFGFYNRNGSFGDITQIGAQRAAVSEADWITWLSTNFGNNQGLDQPAAKYAERRANGLKWTIYRTSSKGLPVDIAFAKSGNDTLMVLLICNPDEHDALYDTVFLHVIDATVSSK